MFGWINKKRLLFLGSIQWSNPWQILCNEGARSEIPLLISYWVSNDNKIAVYICQRKQKGSHLGLSRSRYLHHEIQITYIEKFFYLGIFLSKYILNYSSFHTETPCITQIVLGFLQNCTVEGLWELGLNYAKTKKISLKVGIALTMGVKTMLDEIVLGEDWGVSKYLYNRLVEVKSSRK